MVLVTGDRYLDSLVKFVENNVEPLIEGTLVLKLNPIGLHYVHSRLEALSELESLLSGAPVDYLRAYVSDLGDHRALERLRRILRLLTSLKVVSVLPAPSRDPTPLSLLNFGRLRVLELRGCDLSTSAARGLLELRHTLEKLICHNSTDALRHVFASRIADIRNSPNWTRLSFISCARNGLVLMDESLQLLPAVETLDLSRNKFAKVDNLRKCTKLKHLDLGFNHLRNIAAFREVSCHIVKLVMRNNALTTLRGIENLKSLQGLDISYNIISNLFEIEILASLPSLQSLWLEGNPLCCARWYRAQVFSFFRNPEKMELDEKKICTTELWQRQIIIAGRQKRPSSFGFYSPARDGAKLERTIYTKRKKISRLASIESEEQNSSICSDPESASCEIEIQSKEENALSDEEAEMVELMNRIENMKKERSDVWLQEFKDWINDPSGNFLGVARCRETVSSNLRDNELKTQTRDNQIGETSKYLSDSVLASGDDSSTNMLESDNSFAETSGSIYLLQYPSQTGEATSKFSQNNTREPNEIATNRYQDSVRTINNEVLKHPTTTLFQSDSLSTQRGVKMSAKINIPPLIDTDNLGSHSSLASTGSPPHYKKDILHRRQNLEEELLQLSAESFSIASSDSDTSCSDEEYPELASFSLIDVSPINNFSEKSVDNHSPPVHLPRDLSHEILYPIKINCIPPDSLGIEGNSNCTVAPESDTSWQGHLPADRQAVESEQIMKQDSDWLEKKKRRRKPARRIISLHEENEDPNEETAKSKKSDADMSGSRDGVGDAAMIASDRASCKSALRISVNGCGKKIQTTRDPLLWVPENLIKNYFDKQAAESGVDESCQRYVICNLLLEEKAQCSEREVAVALSSKNKLYVLLLENSCDGSGSSLHLVGYHGFEQKREILVGLGLQIVRVCFESETTYVFLTRNIDMSRELLQMLGFADSHVVENNCSMQSLELVQADLFERHVCGGLRMSIFLYSMVKFQCDSLMKEDSWLRRSVFLLERHLLLCVEDATIFGSLSESASCSSYFMLDSCCSIIGVSQMVIETRDCNCVTLTVEGVMSVFPLRLGEGKVAEDTSLIKKKHVPGPQKWKLEWFTEESLFKFVALLKALHGEATTNPLLVYHHH